MLQTRWFRIAFGIILFLVIVYLANKDSFLFDPFRIMFKTLLIPFIASGFFYYLLRPLVTYLSRKVKKSIAVLLIYIVFGGITIVVIGVLGPSLQTQFTNFINNVPSLIEGFQQQLDKLQENRLLSSYFQRNGQDLSNKMTEYLSQGVTMASNHVMSFFTLMTNFIIIISTVPIVLYYMFKDGHKLPDFLLRFFPLKHKPVCKEIMEEIDAALSGFIQGRILICLFLGVMIYIGYLLIGIDYPLLLAVVAMILNIIPYIGPIIGVIPSLIVAFIHSPSQVVWVIVIVLVAQQVDGNLIGPYIYGKSLEIHPLTVVVILLVAGEIAGVLGIILAIPVYLVLKIIILHINRLFIFRYE